MAQRTSTLPLPQGRLSTPASHLSSVVERILVRHRRASSALDELTLLPMGQAAYRPVRTGPTEPGTPRNIRVNDPGEDTIYGNKTAQSEPTLAVCGHTVVVAFNDSTPIGSFAGLAHSVQLGQSFTDEGALTPADESGNPHVVVDGQGVFHCAMCVLNVHTQESRIGVSTSPDGGLSFPLPAFASGLPAEDSRVFEDRPRLAVDLSDGPRRGHLYLCWTRFEGFDWTTGAAASSRILLARSQDGGATWSEPQALTGPRPAQGPQGAVAAVDAEGRVYVAWLARDRAAIELVRSDDGGATFLNPVADSGAVARFTPLEGTLTGDLRAENPVGLAVDPLRGALCVAFAATAQGATADVYFTRSLDQGRTWSPSLRVNDDQTDTDQWLPCVAVTADGIVGVMYFDRRNDPADNLNIDVYLAQSLDGGVSFLPSRRITTSSFPPPVSVDPLVAAQHLGESNQLVAAGTRFFMAWGDNRDFVGRRNDPNVYYATVGTQDCYLRDDPLDDGTVPKAGLACVSPDISLEPGAVLVTVRNRGPRPARDVAVRLAWSEPATHVPAQAWRTDHLAVDGHPASLQWIEEIPAGGSAVVPAPFLWTPPCPGWAPGQAHFCLCAQVEHRGDPVEFPAGAEEGLLLDNNLAIRSVHSVLLGGEPAHLRFLVAGGAERLWLADLVLDARALPAGLRLELALPEAILWYAKFEGLKVLRRSPGGTRERRGAPPATEASMLEGFERLNVTFAFEPGRVARVVDLELPAGSRHLVQLTLAPDGTPLDRSRSALHVQQLVNRVAVGGLLYQFDPQEP